MSPIRFNSALNPDKWGFEFTNDSNTFFDYAYRNTGVLNCSFGYYETHGDRGVQHSPLAACHEPHFTDYCISLARYLVAHPDTPIHTYAFHLDAVQRETALFLGSLVWREGKTQYYNIVDRKVSTAEGKRFDKRWREVPKWANGTVASAYSIWMDGRSGMICTFERYALTEAFEQMLYSVCSRGYSESQFAQDWDKITAFKNALPGDHRQAFRALEQAIRGIEAFEWSKRNADSATYNSTPKSEAA